MIRDDDFERAVENYVLEKASIAERRAVEEALRGHGAVHAQVTDLLRFERAIEQASQVQPFAGDVVAEIQERMVRELSKSMDRDFVPELAMKTLNAAIETGKLRLAPTPHRPFLSRAGALRAAAAILVVAGLYSWVITDLISNEKPYRVQLQEAARAKHVDGRDDDSLIRVVYDRPDNLLKRPRTLTDGLLPVSAGASLATDRENGAFLLLPKKDGHLVLLPETKITIERGPKPGTIQIRLIQGGMRVDVDQSRPVFVRSRDDIDAEGKIAGQGDIFLVADDRAEPMAPSVPLRALVVKVSSGGQADFMHRGAPVRLAGDELAVLAPTGAVTMPDEDTLADNAPSSWTLPAVVPNAEAPALVIDDVKYSRLQLVREALHAYGTELVEQIAKSAVTLFELDEMKISPSAEQRLFAERFVRNDEVLAVAPMRGAEAVRERTAQTAALLAIAAKKGESPAADGVVTRMVVDRTWRELTKLLRIEWKAKDPRVAFTIDYRGHQWDVTYAEAWQKLQQSLRVVEVETMMSDIVRRRAVADWLDERGVHAAAPAIAASRAWQAAEAALIRILGAPRQLTRDRRILTASIMPFITPPSDAEVKAFLADAAKRNQGVVFERWFVPAVDLEQGVAGEDAARRRASAERTAFEIIQALRAGVSPASPADLSGGAFYYGSAIGPRPWWSELYGRRYAEIVTSLGEGQISDPIAVPEGYEVIAVTKAMHQNLTGEQANAWARVAIMTERAQRMIDEIVAKRTVRRIGAEDLLAR